MKPSLSATGTMKASLTGMIILHLTVAGNFWLAYMALKKNINS
jgi:hypothetical protein